MSRSIMCDVFVVEHVSNIKAYTITKPCVSFQFFSGGKLLAVNPGMRIEIIDSVTWESFGHGLDQLGCHHRAAAAACNSIQTHRLLWAVGLCGSRVK
jgi:hypothetical protein